jgi:N-acetylglutamate synthase-like GNAT family acetyltransferase
MNSQGLRVRRATVDDLQTLKAIWTSMRLPADALEGRLTEFQVAEAGGQIAGTVGFQIAGRHALLHHEAYADFSLADAARELFLKRIESLAANHGVFRLWTQEGSPFWTHVGFQPANAETLARLPQEWENPGGGWLTLQLKNEEAITTALEDKFAGFMNAEKNQTARVAEKGRTLRNIITAAGFLIFAACMAILIYWFMHGRLSSR